ncbi:hypothetical protein BXT86_01950 [candidate division WOR-3 bacterium 4484_100]|uniref:UPF0033 domain-containing protein n=1 Tax=candidate division WOR-3 bacterium 4484_100 TaxID=1936077 RepID=A0A1V4QH04_UNCW3|nr:MAG: hypothetical protein BXT86_01950 [candidate division WOR-3 bacterium 4484_100]
MDIIVPTKTIDCTGLYCPIPLFQTRSALEELNIDEILEVIADDPAAEEDIKRFIKRTKNILLKLEKTADTLKFYIKKTG